MSFLKKGSHRTSQQPSHTTTNFGQTNRWYSHNLPQHHQEVLKATSNIQRSQDLCPKNKPQHQRQCRRQLRIVMLASLLARLLELLLPQLSHFLESSEYETINFTHRTLSIGYQKHNFIFHKIIKSKLSQLLIIFYASFLNFQFY